MKNRELQLGVSGLACQLPQYRVKLADWCSWYARHWESIRSRVGEAFRICGPDEDVYALAAGAALKLIVRHGLDPRRIGFLGLGTESSTDGAVGAVIVKGLLDRALPTLGLPPLARECEVPEVKHACLGGIYAMKAGLRYLALDGRGRQAIVVCADLASYPRGSSGEETQGAGAVALLLEEQPRLFLVDLFSGGSSSQDRVFDFRKPMRRLFLDGGQPACLRALDHPLFNGRYTTICYIDELFHAMDDLLRRTGVTPRQLYHEVEGVFMHRPYQRLPETALSALYLRALQAEPEHQQELEGYCRAAGCDPARVMLEMSSSPDLFTEMVHDRLEAAIYPESMKLVRHFRSTAKFHEVVTRKMALGSATMRELGNLYCGALPAWIAAGLEQAWCEGRDLAGMTFLTLGYGSGDAAEASLIRIVEGWQAAAARIGLARALEPAIDLDQAGYEALHAGMAPAGGLPAGPPGRFEIERIGQRQDQRLTDAGIPYYRFVHE